MIYEEVTLEKNFQVGDFLFEKAIIKGRLEPGETIAEALTAARKEAVEWFKNNNPQLHHSSAIEMAGHNAVNPLVLLAEKSIPEEQRVAILLADILACTELPKPKGLLSYENLVKSANKPDITAAYNLMFKKLSK